MSRGRRDVIVYTLAALCVGAAAAQFCAAGEGLLREVWQRRHPRKTQQLQQARQHLASLEEMCGDPETVGAARESEPMKWLRAHPEISYVLADQQLASRPQGARRQAVLLLTRVLGRKELGHHLPSLLRTSVGNPQRLAVVRTMAALGDARSLEALEGLLTEPPEDADEELLAAAVRGLGRSRQERFLPLIEHVRAGFTSDRACLAGAKAAYRCGAPEAMLEVTQVLRLRDDDAEEVLSLKLDAMRFMTRHFNGSLVAPLADLAVRTENRRIAVQAMRSLIAGTGYAAPDAETLSGPPAPPAPEDLYDPREPAAEGGGEGDAEDPPAGASPHGLPPDLEALTAEQREQLVEKIVKWWHAEGEPEFHKRRELQAKAPS
ncbi:MAG: hypothetical protein R6X33_06790 [Candidatus Brocadiia bacterium]